MPSGNLFYRAVYYALSSVENRSYETWLSPDTWVNHATVAGLRHVRFARCGGLLPGFYKRLFGSSSIVMRLPDGPRLHYIIAGRR